MKDEHPTGPNQEVMDAICDLAGHLAHDLNNFMTPILACGQMLKDGLDADHPLYFCGEQIVQAGEECFGLSKRLQAMGSKRLGNETVDLHELAAHAVRVMTARDDFRATVDLDSGGGPASVKGDHDQFLAMLEELLRNANFAMPDGGRIEFGVGTENGEVVVRVRDHGVGMDEKVRALIYTPYFTTHRGSHSRGLGLTMVYGLIKRHGGEIECESSPGKGAVFTLRLPAVPAA